MVIATDAVSLEGRLMALHRTLLHHRGFDLGEWWWKRRSDGAWILMGRAGKALERLREETWRLLDAAEKASGSRAPP